MKKLATVFVAIVALAFAACAKKATPDEVKKAYAKLVELQKAANPAPVVENPAVKINGDFAQKMQALQAAQNEAVKAVDAELAAAKEALPKAKGKKAEAANAAAAAKLDEEFAAKKGQAGAPFAPQFAGLNKAKADALKAAADAAAKAEADAKAQADKDQAAYTDKAVKDRTTKAKVDCQVKAAKLDEFNKCK
jgi:colicin import membrane protein